MLSKHKNPPIKEFIKYVCPLSYFSIHMLNTVDSLLIFYYFPIYSVLQDLDFPANLKILQMYFFSSGLVPNFVNKLDRSDK